MNWFALTVRPQHEEVTCRSLAACGVQNYLPLYRERRRWSDRYKTIEVPLIPGYVFARFARSQRTTVLRAHGVRSIVQFGGEPAPIPECDLESMRKLVASGYPVEPWAGLVPGQKVRIDSGPLAGAQGVFVRRKTDCCLAVSIDILGRSVIATLDPEAVFPLMPHDSWS